MKKIIILFALSLLVSCSHVFYQPTKTAYFTPDQFKLEYKEYKFKSKDGTELDSWLIKADPKVKRRGLIVHFHGNAQNLSASFSKSCLGNERGL